MSRTVCETKVFLILQVGGLAWPTKREKVILHKRFFWVSSVSKAFSIFVCSYKVEKYIWGSA